MNGILIQLSFSIADETGKLTYNLNEDEDFEHTETPHHQMKLGLTELVQR